MTWGVKLSMVFGGLWLQVWTENLAWAYCKNLSRHFRLSPSFIRQGS